MSREYNVIRLIQREESNPEIRKICVNAFNKIYDAQEPDGCLSTSAALYMAFRYTGIQSRIKVGQIILQNSPVYHAWLETDVGKIYDIAVYGNTAFNPICKRVGIPIVMPQIAKTYSNADIRYYPDKLDNDFQCSGIGTMYGKSLRYYCDHAPRRNIIYELALGYLGLSPTSDNIRYMRDLTDGAYIGAEKV